MSIVTTQEPKNTIQPLPKTLVLGGVSYSVDDNPELSAFVDAVKKTASQTEKAKLYTQIKSLSEKITELQKVPIESSSQQTPAIDIEALKNDLRSEISEDVSNKVTSSLKGLLDPLVQRNRLQEEASVNDYRNKLIMENQGTIIEELLVGNTREELDAALVNSKNLFSKYGKTLVQLGPNGAIDTSVAPANQVPPVTPQQPATTVPVQQTATPVVTPPAKTVVESGTNLEIGKMSQDEFARRRDELAAEIKNMVAG